MTQALIQAVEAVPRWCHFVIAFAQFAAMVSLWAVSESIVRDHAREYGLRGRLMPACLCLLLIAVVGGTWAYGVLNSKLVSGYFDALGHRGQGLYAVGPGLAGILGLWYLIRARTTEREPWERRSPQ